MEHLFIAILWTEPAAICLAVANSSANSAAGPFESCSLSIFVLGFKGFNLPHRHLAILGNIRTIKKKNTQALLPAYSACSKFLNVSTITISM